MRISASVRRSRRPPSFLVLISLALALLPLLPAQAMNSVGLPGAPADPPLNAEAPDPSVTAPLRVGLQVGHWQIAALPDSLARLRGDTGTAGGGRSEVSLNLDIARRVAAILQAQGVAVDILPATVPTGYRANAFLAIHADGNSSTRPRGYKIATRWRSGVAEEDLALVDTLDSIYGDLTGLPRDSAVTRNMRGYYAINTWLGDDSRISDFTPGAIIEMGYMTNPADRALMFDQPDLIATAIARGLIQFLQTRVRVAPLQAQAEAVAAASLTQRAAVVLADDTPLRSNAEAGAPIVAHADHGQSLLYLDSTTRPKGPFTKANLHGAELAAGFGSYRVALPDSPTLLFINRDAVVIQQPGN